MKNIPRQHLEELIEQWEETASLYREERMYAAVIATIDCIRELQKIVDGDMTPIERL